MAHRIFTNFLYLLLSRIVTQLLFALALIYLARILGPVAFGKLNVALAILTYFMIIPDLGLPILGTREIAKRPNNVKPYLANIFPLRLCLGLVSFVLLLALTWFLRLSTDFEHLVLLLGISLIPFSMVLDWVFQGIGRMEFIAFPRVISGLTYFILIVSVIKTSGHLLLIPYIYLIGNLVLIFCQYSIFARQYGWMTLRYDLLHWKDLIEKAFPIGLTVMMGPFILYVDTLLLGLLKGDEVVGFYNAAWRIIITLVMLSIAYQDSLFPIISRYYAKSVETFIKIESLSAKCVVSFALPVAVGGTMLAPDIMRVIYGHNYESSVVAFRILIWSFAFEIVYHVFARGLVASNRLKERLKVVTIITSLNIVLNLILIPLIGMKGAAVAMVVTRVVGFLLFYNCFHDLISYPIYYYLFRPLLATVVMSLFIYFFAEFCQPNLLLLVVAGMTTYSVVLFLIKGFKRDEIRILANLLIGTSRNC